MANIQLQIQNLIKLADVANNHVKITRSRLCLFYFSFSFLFSLDLLFIFLFLEQLGLGSEVIGHTVISVTI